MEKMLFNNEVTDISNHPDNLKGDDVTGCHSYYENIRVYDKDKNEYFLSYDELKKILQTVKFKTDKRKKRVWLIFEK